MPRTTTFGKLPVGTPFRFVDSGLVTYYKVAGERFALGPNGYGGTEYEAKSTLVRPLTRKEAPSQD